MKMSFIFDTVMLKDEKNNYYAINLNYELWKERYLKVFDNVIVSTRVKYLPYSQILKKRGYTISNGKNVYIEPIIEYKKITDIFIKYYQIEKHIKEIVNNADCVIIRLPSPLGNIACDICRKLNKKYAIEMVACAWDGYWNYGYWAGKVVAPFMYLVTKFQCKKAKRVLYVTESFLQKRYPTNGININASNVMINEQSEKILKERILTIKNKNKNNNITLGLVGTLELKYKGHIYAIKALKKLIFKYPNMKLELLGNGEGKKLRKIVRKYNLENNVIFKGTLPSGNPVLSWMKDIDILVIPSLQEGLPRVLIEAMSVGCPAVGANTGGIPELINKSVIHNPKDFNKLADDIDRICSNNQYAIKLATENFNNAKKYTRSNLDKKRNEFWQNFKNSNF